MDWVLIWLSGIFCGIIVIAAGYPLLGLSGMALISLVVAARVPRKRPQIVLDSGYRCPTCRAKDQVRYQARGSFDFPHCYRCSLDVGPCRPR